MAIALADTAVVNGCEFHGGCAVTGIEREADGFRLHTTGGDFLARRVINAAGTHADAVNAFVAAPYFRIQPSKGQYYLLDKSQGELVGATVFQCPSAAGKGVLVSPTVHGNLIVGPDAIPAAGPDDVAVTAQGLSFVAGMARRSVPGFNLRESIRNFAGVRAISDRDDFIVEEAPGLSRVHQPVGNQVSRSDLGPRPGEGGGRAAAKGAALSCRSGRDSACIPAAALPVRRSAGSGSHGGGKPADGPGDLPVRNGDGGGNRRSDTRTGSRPFHRRGQTAGGQRHGPVPGGFCSPRIAAILARELNIPLTAVLQDGEGTEILTEELGHEYHRI